jgi:predicted dehydrogenase
MRSAQKPVALASVGVSGYAGVLIDCFQPLVDAGRARWVAVSTRDRQRDAVRCDSLEAGGAVIYDNWREMIDRCHQEIDLLVLPTAIQVHREMAEYALSRGLRVFLEKPLAPTLADAERILAASRSGGGGLVIGYQDMYLESTWAIKEALVAGDIGEILSMRGLALWPRNTAYYTRNSWAGKLRDGTAWVLDSPVNNAMAHFLNLLLFWAGEEVDGSATPHSVDGLLLRGNPIESFDTASFRIQTGRGFPIDFHCSHACEENFGPEILIEGTRGQVRWLHEREAVVEGHGVRRVLPLPNSTETRRKALSSVIDWVNGQDIRCSTATQSICHTRLVALLHESREIHSVDHECVRTTGGQTVITGIDARLRECFRDGLILEDRLAMACCP